MADPAATERPIVVGLNAVILAVTAGVPRVLTVDAGQHPFLPEEAKAHLDALPYGPLADEDRTLELALRRWVREQTGMELGYVEQLYTLGDRERDPRGQARLVSVAYLALVREVQTGGHWRDWYEFFPWEDWREGQPEIIQDEILPGLQRWVEESERREDRLVRSERVQATFGQRGAPWDGERVLERYELLYEGRLVAEARAPRLGSRRPSGLGRPMAIDHRRIAATALGRLRGKLKYRPVVFELVQDAFTLSQLQEVVEALAGVGLHKQNFRRLLERNRLVEGTGELDPETGGRPAERFRFRREVLLERAAPGVGLPEVRSRLD